MATLAMNIDWSAQSKTLCCDACGGDLNPIFYHPVVVRGTKANVCSAQCIAFLQKTWKPTNKFVRIVKRFARRIIF